MKMDFKAIVAIIIGVPVCLVLIGGALLPAIQSGFPTSSVSAATDYLEGKGYVVLSSPEYDLLAKEATAAAAVANAEAAVVNAEAAATASQETLDTLLLHNENVVFLYPDSVTATVTFTAGTPANNFTAWTEIADNSTVTLSSKFAVNSGYIVEIMTHDYSAADEIYIIELAYGAAKTVVGRVKLRSDWTYVLTLRSSPVTPAGQTVYYRMKAETAGATLQADFRYYYD